MRGWRVLQIVDLRLNVLRLHLEHLVIEVPQTSATHAEWDQTQKTHLQGKRDAKTLLPVLGAVLPRLLLELATSMRDWRGFSKATKRMALNPSTH